MFTVTIHPKYGLSNSYNFHTMHNAVKYVYEYIHRNQHYMFSDRSATLYQADLEQYRLWTEACEDVRITIQPLKFMD